MEEKKTIQIGLGTATLMFIVLTIIVLTIMWFVVIKIKEIRTKDITENKTTVVENRLEGHQVVQNESENTIPADTNIVKEKKSCCEKKD